VAPPGWKHWFGAVDPSTYQYYGFTLLEHGTKKTYAKRPSLYQTDVLTDIAVSQIHRAAKAGSPFFLDVAYLAPHAQVNPRRGDTEASNAQIGRAVPAPQDAKRYADEPLPHSASFDEADVSDKPRSVRALPRITPAVANQIRRAYDATLGSLLDVDRGVQRIVDALQETGQLGRTYLLFTSDNGFLNGEHRIPAGKVFFYEPSIRVPLLVRGPTVPHNVTRHALVANIDLAPTILDLTHVAPRRTMDGRPLTPLFKADSRADRSILLESGAGFSPNAGVRTPRYAYFSYATQEHELYDLQTDPDELHNVYGDPTYASVRADMQTRLTRLQKCAGATCN
jgi:arylsulfatase A-like enzyme